MLVVGVPVAISLESVLTTSLAVNCSKQILAYVVAAWKGLPGHKFDFPWRLLFSRNSSVVLVTSFQEFPSNWSTCRIEIFYKS